MRRFLVLLALLALVLPASAWAVQRAPGDGTLSVRAAEDYVALNVRGAVLGRTAGYIEIVEPKDGDCSAESVFGASRTVEITDRSGRLVCRYTGANVRFRLVGGRQWVRVWGPDIWISAVGRGDVWLQNRDDDRIGTYALDADRPAALPVRLTRLTLGLPLPSGGSG